MQRKHSAIITARMTPGIKDLIQHQAKQAGMTVTDYIITCALGKEIVRVDGLDEILAEVKAQGRNLNQLTTLANMGRIILPPVMVGLLREYRKEVFSPLMFPSRIKPNQPIAPSYVRKRLQQILERADCKKVSFHDLRHPYVKHTTKIFSLRLMDSQAQAYPDARRKTRGACQLLRVGQSRSPVRPLCNRKRFS